MSYKAPMNRRSFLRRTTQAAGAAALPGVIPPAVLGANAPSEKIVMGAIGVGGMGLGDMQGFLGRSQVQFVGVCDVDRNHRTRAQNK